jgi:large subunit ribosomal protein L5
MAEDNKQDAAGGPDQAEKPAKPKGAKAAKGKGAKAGAGKGKGDRKQKKGPRSDAPPPVYKREQPPRLRGLFESEIKGKLQKEFGYKNVNQIPRLVKITVNMGLGAAVQNPKIIESAVEELRLIAGQGPVVTKAKADIANFKLRIGNKIGCMVTLRGPRMWEFYDRLVNVALPRVRDFKGVSDKAFDGRGNYSLGIREQIIFPEIEYDNIDAVRGMNISIVTTARTDDEGRALLRHLGMPFRSRAKEAAAA